jgi:hypothetical protein
MKSFSIICLFTGLILVACKKGEQVKTLEEDNGCIQKLVIPVNARETLSNADYNLINALFTTNGIDHSHLRFIRTYRDSVHAYNGTFDFRWVQVLEYPGGLPLFTGGLNYLFKNGIFSGYAGSPLNGATPDSSQALTPGQLRKLIIDDIEFFNHKGYQFRDSCFNAEFGYYNLNSGTGNNTENIVKAWHLTPENSDYPEGYYQDNGQKIYYFDGIVYGH